MNKGKAIIQEKKIYEEPRLVNWGTLTELTQGTTSGTDDFPDPQGTGTGFAPPWTPK